MLKTKNVVFCFVLLGILAGIVALRLADPFPIASLRLTTFDYYQKLMPRELPQGWETTSPVIIVDIDEKSLSTIGQFPWPRYRFAELIDRLKEGGIAAIGFDILFSEPDRTSPGNLFADLKELGYNVEAEGVQDLQNINFDEILARSIESAPVVLGQVAVNREIPLRTQSAQQTSVKGFFGNDPAPFIPTFKSLVHNVPALEEAGAHRALLSITPEIDGVVRRIPLVSQVADEIKPTLSIETLRVGMRSPMIMLKTDESGIYAASLGVNGQHLNVPSDAHGRVWVYYAKPDYFNTPDNSGRMYVSASDILTGKYPKEKISGRIALVGTSAVGLVDIRATSIEPRQPGVEVHANIIENILSQSFLHYPSWMMLIELSLLIIGLLSITILLFYASPWASVLVFLTYIAAVMATSLFLYREKHLFFDATYLVICMFLIYVSVTFMRFRKNSLEKQQVRSAFGQYLSPALVEELANDPKKLALGGERKSMTLLFCDVREFTSISEIYRENPEGLTRLINRLLTPLTDVILRYGGTVDKYMGDCIMAFWNAPIACENHAGLALQSTMEMHQALAQLNVDLAAEAAESGVEHKQLAIGIGINSGEVVVGNMGSQQRFDYSVLGDAVNLAARLEGQSKNYGVGTVIGEDSRALMNEEAQASLFELDLIAVKGKSQAVRIFTVLGATSEQRDQIIAHQQMFLQAYRAMQWDEAEQLAQDGVVLTEEVSGYYKQMQERIVAYRAFPPAQDWGGVHVASTK